MEAIGNLEWEDGVLKASSANLPTLSWTRPGDLAEARLECDPPVSALELADGGDMLDAAFRIVPFVREPLPRPVYGDGVTMAGREAFNLFLGQNVSERADSFRVLRGEVDDFILCARRYHDVWKVAAFSKNATTLTVRFEDLWNQLPKDAVKYTDYLAEVVRDPNSADASGSAVDGLVRETLPGVAPDARICIDIASGGGFTITFWPVAAVR